MLYVFLFVSHGRIQEDYFKVIVKDSTVVRDDEDSSFGKKSTDGIKVDVDLIQVIYDVFNFVTVI